jgi:hypothetical protein
VSLSLNTNYVIFIIFFMSFLIYPVSAFLCIFVVYDLFFSLSFISIAFILFLVSYSGWWDLVFYST